MKLTKAQIKTLNELARTNWEKAQGMLEGMNMILGTNYTWLNKRVVFHFEAHGRFECHDAYCWAE